MKKLGIIGCGGFGREVLDVALRIGFKKPEIIFFDSDEVYKNKKINEISVFPMSKFIARNYNVVIAIGNPKIRLKVVKQLPLDTNYINIISNNAIISDNVKLGKGTIIMDFCYVTDNVVIGNHAQLNNNSSIGHDSIVGDFFTTAAGVRISGSCRIGNNVYFGNNSSTIQGINICDNVRVGINSSVLKSIKKDGTYFGSPANKIF